MSSGSIFINRGGERADFDLAVQTIQNSPGVSANAQNNAVYTQSFLRSIVPLNATSTTFVWQILNNQNNAGLAQRPDEVRLTQQDCMFISKVWVYVFNGTGYNWVPKTYPSTESFAAGSAGLYAFYNGVLSINVNNSVIVPAYPMQKFLQIPPTQFTAASDSPSDQFDGTLVQPWQPCVVFNGLNQTTVTVTLPQACTALDANSFAVLYVEGVRAQNVALGAPM
jgi:hypothetical protein